MKIKIHSLVLGLILVNTAFSAEPTVQTFIYQGKIEKNSAPFNGSLEVTMGMYPDDSGGSILSSWVQVVTVIDGSFSFDYAIKNNELNGEQRWLEIWVRDPPGSGSWNVLSPRQPIRPAPYAIHALGGGGDAIWIVDNASIYYNDGDVGIGTNNPTEKLSVAGNVLLSSNSSLLGSNGGLGFLNNLGDSGGGAQLVNAGSIDLILDSDNNDILRSFRVMSDGTDRSSATTLLSVLETGETGVGTAIPDSRLHVIGGVDAGLATGGYLQLGSTAGKNLVMDTNEIMARNNGAISHLYLNHDGGHVVIADNGFGRLGIGTETPNNALHVVGTTLTTGFRMPTGAASGRILTSDFNGVASWQDPGQGLWSTNGSSIYYNDGMVGIGAQTPVTKLQVHDPSAPIIRLSGNNGNANNGTIEFSETRSQADANFQIVYNGTSDQLIFRTYDGAVKDRMTLTRNQGYLGIGTMTPKNPLDVNGAMRQRSNEFTNLLLNGGGFGDAYLDLVKTGNTTVSARIQLDGRTNANSHVADIRFLTRNTGQDLLERMVIRDNGRVGIGVALPGNLLDVQGAGAAIGGLAPPETIARFKQTAAANENSAISVDALPNQDAIIYLAENGAATWDIRNNEDYLATGSSDDRFQIAYRKGGIDDMTLTITPQPANYMMNFNGSMEIDGGIEVNGDIFPASDTGGSLGSASRRWSSAWVMSSIPPLR